MSKKLKTLAVAQHATIVYAATLLTAMDDKAPGMGGAICKYNGVQEHYSKLHNAIKSLANNFLDFRFGLGHRGKMRFGRDLG